MEIVDIMTRDVLALPTTATVAHALDRAQLRDVHHILVVEDEDLIGVTCVCDLRDQPRSMGLLKCVARAPISIQPHYTLLEAADRFVATGVSCFPVCEGSRLVGVVTRSDLRRSLVPEARLPASFECSFCGSTRHVRPHDHDMALAWCLDCSDRAAPADSGLYDEGDQG